jgi:hypothetical protein
MSSGGGIVAFGLGVQQLKVTDCAEKFKVLSSSSFEPRSFAKVPIFGRLIEARHEGKYKTKCLTKALHSAFGEAPIFGANQNEGDLHQSKVAVTSTCSNKAYLLANYNRPSARTTPEQRMPCPF